MNIIVDYVKVIMQFCNLRDVNQIGLYIKISESINFKETTNL
jgi:hypothetical protein